MTKELSELTIIRLQTELENAIGFREHFLNTDDIVQYNVWDLEVEQLLEEIKCLGGKYEK